MIKRAAPRLGRSVFMRKGTSDERTWADVFTGLYHVPPDSMPPPTNVLDLGANIGLTAAHYQVMWPSARILAVEMDFRNAEVARSNFRGIVFEKAVTGFGGQWAYNPHAECEAYSLEPVGEKTVDTISLLNLCVLFFGDSPVDFCKMDIEGSEWSCFQAGVQGWWPDIRHLLVELHGSPDETSAEIVGRGIDMLERIGYHTQTVAHPQGLWAWR